MAKKNLVAEMVQSVFTGTTGSLEDLGKDIEIKHPVAKTTMKVDSPTLSEDEKITIRKARSAKQGRPTDKEREAQRENPPEGKKAIGVQISDSLYLRLDKALARTGKTKRDFIEELLTREYERLGV